MDLKWIDQLGLVTAIILPMWNIPLIVRIIQRKSSEDISMWWAMGVWVCMMLMFPSGLRSHDMVWRTYNIINFFLFSGVVVVTLRYRKGRKRKG